jgi:hypothetical protein
MRYDRISVRESYYVTGFPDAQRKSVGLANDPDQSAAFRSAAGMPDVPVGVGRMIVACYVAMAIAFAVGTSGGRDIDFALIIVGLFVAMYFTLPRILLGLEPKGAKRPSLERFLSEGMMTYTGRTGGVSALTQILIVPVCLVAAAVAMSAVARWFL